MKILVSQRVFHVDGIVLLRDLWNQLFFMIKYNEQKLAKMCWKWIGENERSFYDKAYNLGILDLTWKVIHRDLNHGI